MNWIWITIIVILVIFVMAVVVLALIGRKVTIEEQNLNKLVRQQKLKVDQSNKRKRQSTPKVPTIKK